MVSFTVLRWLMPLIVIRKVAGEDGTYQITTTDPLFPISANNSLKVQFVGDQNDVHQIMTPGENWDLADVKKPPKIGADSDGWTFNDAKNNTKGILIMIDSDVPHNGSRSMLLHWFVQDVPVQTPPFLVDTLPPSFADYKPPNPPQGDTAHSYTFMLLEQPDGFALSDEWARNVRNRTEFDVVGFVDANNISVPAIAANFFRVKNEAEGDTGVVFPPPRETGDSRPTTDDAGGDGDDGDDDKKTEKKEGAAVGLVTKGQEAVFWSVLLGSTVICLVMVAGL